MGKPRKIINIFRYHDELVTVFEDGRVLIELIANLEDDDDDEYAIYHDLPGLVA